MGVLSLIFIPGKSGNDIGQAMNSDSIILCLWVDFTSFPRDYINFVDFTRSILQELVLYALNMVLCDCTISDS